MLTVGRAYWGSTPYCCRVLDGCGRSCTRRGRRSDIVRHTGRSPHARHLTMEMVNPEVAQLSAKRRLPAPRTTGKRADGTRRSLARHVGSARASGYTHWRPSRIPDPDARDTRAPPLRPRRHPASCDGVIGLRLPLPTGGGHGRQRSLDRLLGRLLVDPETREHARAFLEFEERQQDVLGPDMVVAKT